MHRWAETAPIMTIIELFREVEAKKHTHIHTFAGTEGRKEDFPAYSIE